MTQQPPVDRSTHQNTKHQETQQKGVPFWERLLGLLGLILVAGATGFMLYQGTQTNTPPDLSVHPRQIILTNSGYLVQLDVTNQGGSTAANVLVTGELIDGSAPIESREITFDYLPPHSTRQGGLIFRHDPHQFELQLHAQGFKEP